jgi:hypothetical protein
MTQEISAVKRLNQHFSILKQLEQVDNPQQLHKRKEKTHYPDGYSGAPVTKKEIKDDFILILPIKGTAENIGFTLNHLNRELDDVELIVGVAFRNELVRTLTLSEPVKGFEDIKKHLNSFVKQIKENPECDLIALTEKQFGIELTKNNKSTREFVRERHSAKIKRIDELQKKSIGLMAESESLYNDIPAILAETEEAKDVARLKKELEEAEIRLHQKRQSLYKPIEEKEKQKDGMLSEIHRINIDINKYAKKTEIGENTNKPETARKYKV